MGAKNGKEAKGNSGGGAASLLDRLPFDSLRAALLLLVALAVLPAVILIIRTAEDRHALALKHGKQVAAIAARRAAQEYRDEVVRARVLLKTLAHLPEIRAHEVERCRPLLQEALEANAAFANIGLTDAAGKRLCSAVEGERALDVSDRPYFQATMEGNRFTIGQYQIGRITGDAIINFAFPVRDESGASNGVLYALMEPRHLVSLAAASPLPDSSALVVLDRTGRILARDPADPSWSGRSVPWHADAEAAVATTGEGRGIFADIDGERRNYFVSRIGFEDAGGALYVGVGIPGRLTSEPARRVLERSLWTLGAVALLTLILAWIVSGVLVLRPVRSLIRDTQRLAAGDMSKRSEQVFAAGEVGDLTRSFDHMASSLRHRSAERDRAIEALTASKASLKAVFEATQDGILTIDGEGVITEASPTAEATFGYSSDELIGQRMHEVLIPGELREVFERHLTNAATDDTEPLFKPRAEFLALRKNGSRFPVELNSRRVLGEGPPTFTIYLRDLTDQKRLAAQFLEAQKMEAIGRLAAGIAHDFNNALTVVSGFSELILASGVNGEVHAHAERIHHAGQQAASLVQRILAFSRRQMCEPVWLDLNEEVARMVEFLPPLLGEDVRLAVASAAEPIPVKVDPGQIEQVVANLAVNARDAMPSGGRLELKAAVVDLTHDEASAIGALEAGSYGVLIVADTGSGIPEAVRRRIFDPFFTTKKADKGTGLGLSSCREIARQNAGAITVESRVGSGSEFRIYLPLGAAEDIEERREPDVGEVPGGTETILLVEDDPAVRELAYILLRKLGYTVRRATDGEDALGILAGEGGDEIDLVVTDVVMPRLGGKDLGDQIERTRPDLPIIFTSAYIDRHVLGERLDPARVVFLPKPYASAQLARRVRAALDQGK